jgi:hypothetical protein
MCISCSLQLDAVLTQTGSVISGLCKECTVSALETLPGTCPAGHGRANCHTSACVPCPAGSFAAASVRRSVDTCRSCPINTFSAGLATGPCTPCPTGTAYLGTQGTGPEVCNISHVAGSITFSESFQYSSTTYTSVARVLNVGSGDVVPVSDPKVSVGGYVVLRLPDGRWLVGVYKSSGEVVTCAAVAGPLSLECVYVTGSSRRVLTLQAVGV